MPYMDHVHMDLAKTRNLHTQSFFDAKGILFQYNNYYQDSLWLIKQIWWNEGIWLHEIIILIK